MKITFFTAVASIVIVTICSGRKIKYTDCSKGEINSIDVDPCNSEPCMFKKGTSVTFTIEGKALKDVNNGQLKVTALFGGNEIDVPGIDKDLCNFLKCPVKKGENFHGRMKLKVETWYPDVITTMKWEGIQGNGEGKLFCASATVGIRSSNERKIS